jgi:hypothetical protein
VQGVSAAFGHLPSRGRERGELLLVQCALVCWQPRYQGWYHLLPSQLLPPGPESHPCPYCPLYMLNVVWPWSLLPFSSFKIWKGVFWLSPGAPVCSARCLLISLYLWESVLVQSPGLLQGVEGLKEGAVWFRERLQIWECESTGIIPWPLSSIPHRIMLQKHGTIFLHMTKRTLQLWLN